MPFPAGVALPPLRSPFRSPALLSPQYACSSRSLLAFPLDYVINSATVVPLLPFRPALLHPSLVILPDATNAAVPVPPPACSLIFPLPDQSPLKSNLHVFAYLTPSPGLLGPGAVHCGGTVRLPSFRCDSLFLATINDFHPTRRAGLAILSLTPMSSPPAPKPSPKKSPGSSLSNPFSVDDWSPLPTPLAPRIENPLLVDSKGRVVDENGCPMRTAMPRSARPSAASRSAAPSAGPSMRCHSPTRRHIHIFDGPPSLINQDTPRMRLPISAGAQSAREAAQRRARLRLLNAMQTQELESSARTRPRHRSHTAGYRVPRFLPLTEDELYLTDARPPVKTTERSHHECSICKHVKSHPVIYGCGHCHCYVCSRRALENSWECALCKAPITAPPARNWDAEQAIAFDIPDFVDHSLVSYSWDGLLFPAPKPRAAVSP
ncbi:hypothetical protein DFH06DRAFT_1336117 [Mycena polygramma]|nr:hypothetical protein DFH06DRAFT_1336117 [Mycena polygramma]